MKKSQYPEATQFSRKQISRYGELLRNSDFSNEEAINAVNQWRASHLYPLNTFRATLHRRTRKYGNPVIAQRLKRMPTILHKLERFPTMELGRMQDIAGLRIILKSPKDVYRVRDYYVSGKIKHRIRGEKDYIKNPKPDGYRGIHLIFEYKGSNEKARSYDGLMIELQIRTELQHYWATAVEMAGMMRGESFKNGKGNREWREFFVHASRILEIVEKYARQDSDSITSPDATTLCLACEEIIRLNQQYKIMSTLEAYAKAAKKTEEQLAQSSYYLMITDPSHKKVTVQCYPKEAYASALKDYASLEKENHSKDIDQVLVTAGSIKDLRKAYPNYFLNISKFSAYIRWILEIYNLLRDEA